ncbi:Kelch motif protein [compost metagenome]
MVVNKRRGVGRLGPLLLALSLVACATPTEAPPSVPLEFRLSQARQAPALWFDFYGSGLRQARWSHSTDVIGSWVYVVGGSDSDGQMVTVERAPILKGGDLGAFQMVRSTLRTPRDCHASLVIGSWLYVLGGDHQGSLDTIERAPILKGGDLGSFQYGGTRMTTARDEHTATRLGNYVYVIGGVRGPVQLNSIERAEVRPDGSLGPFSRYRHSLLANRYGHWALVRGGYLYVAGGLSDNGNAGVAERAKIGADGELGPFERTGSSLAERRDSPIAIDLDGWLYVIAGARENAMHIKLNSIEAAPFTDTGLGRFAPAGSLRVGRDYHTVTRIGDWIYTIGGEKTYGGALSSIERARVPSAGPAPRESSGPGRSLEPGLGSHMGEDYWGYGW